LGKERRAAQKAVKVKPESHTSANQSSGKAPVLEHVSGARALLIELQKKVGERPELAEAINKLETALSLLTLETGGLL
jgi:hypothetical protein